ncbi:hypothetical protein BJ875DRAFT_379766 [Amylocarpus encephaloides]|uniref:Transcription factor domain-containing protein n=1 Tax=Amylocarpus encephaloides TaxID=45428 RepID=A0A9P7YFT6_9HELO|nr:hypothetical protein BJ875DRAFT_379766 [Amylocarpus encephaloides]
MLTRPIVIRILSKHVSSIDGKPLPNYYNDHWLPWAIRVPVLVHIALYNTACYQAELQRVPPGVSPSVIALKLQTINMLNSLLASADKCTRDEVAASVVYLTTNEWYFGTDENVQAHLRGLRELVRLKGGIDGKMSDFLRRMIIFCDYHTSSSKNVRTIFPHYTPHPLSIPITLDSPLLISHQKFLDHVNLLRISKETGQILDDMRFLTSSILKLDDSIPTPSEESVQKILATTTWILERIAALPPLMPSSGPATNPYLHTAVRLAALIYLQAIAKRVPLSQACLPQDLAMLFGSMWKVTLTEWRHIPGIFTWIMLSTIEAARYAPQGRLLKSMLKTASFHILACGDNGWEIIDAKLGRFARLQSWLRKDDNTRRVYLIGMYHSQIASFFPCDWC